MWPAGRAARVLDLAPTARQAQLPWRSAPRINGIWALYAALRAVVCACTFIPPHFPFEEVSLVNGAYALYGSPRVFYLALATEDHWRFINSL